MTTHIVPLTDDGKVTVAMHERTGLDHMIALSFVVRLPDMPEYEQLAIFPMYQERWGFCMAQSEQVNGLDFVLPSPGASPEELGACFRAWLGLSGGLFKRWYEAPDRIETMLNDPALLPPEKVSKEDRESPLSPTAEPSSEAA